MFEQALKGKDKTIDRLNGSVSEKADRINALQAQNNEIRAQQTALKH